MPARTDRAIRAESTVFMAILHHVWLAVIGELLARHREDGNRCDMKQMHVLHGEMHVVHFGRVPMKYRW